MNHLMTIDIAHPPLSERDAEALLDESLKKIRHSSSVRVMKIIHGLGALGTPGAQREIVKNWLGANRSKIISFIEGEDLSPANANVQVLLAECDIPPTNDFLYPNGEITIVWIT